MFFCLFNLGFESFTFGKLGVLNEDINHISKNYSPPGSIGKSIRLARGVSLEDVRNQNLKLMPGFRLTWHYSGMDFYQPEPEYFGDGNTGQRHDYKEMANAFTRNGSEEPADLI